MRGAGVMTGLLVLGSFLIPSAYRINPKTAVGLQAQASVSTRPEQYDPSATATLAGRVYGPDGEPAADAELSLAGSGFWPARSVSTGPDGRFLWPDIPPGVYELRASKGRWVSAPLRGLWLEPGSKRVFGLRLAEGRSVSGRVVDARSEEAVGGARVTVADSGIGVHTKQTETDALGRFELWALSSDAQSLYVEAPGYIPAGPVFLDPGEPTLTIALERGGVIEGLVVDASGRPVEGAILRARAEGAEAARARWMGESLGITSGPVPPISAAAGSGSLSLSFFAESQTDSDGRFRLQALPAGSYTLIASHERYAPGASERIRLSAGGRLGDVRIALLEGAQIDGRVSDSRGAALSAIAVELRSTEEPFPRMTSTDAEGSFSFSGVRGRASITALPFKLPPSRTTVDIEDLSTLSVELIIDAELRTLTGRVVDEAGVGIEGVELTVRSLNAQSPLLRKSQSSADGSFSVSALPAPPFQLTAQHPGYSPLRIDSLEETEDVLLVMRPGMRLIGRVIDDWTQDGLAGAKVLLTGPVRHERRSNEDGAFHFPRLPVGIYELSVSHADYEPQTQSLELRRPRYLDEVHELDLIRLMPAGTITGEVRDSLGEPVADAEVTWGDPPSWRRAVRTDARGEFELRGVPPGSIWISARHPAAGEATGTRPVAVRPQEVSPSGYVKLPDRSDQELSAEETEMASGLAVTLETEDDGVRVQSVRAQSAASEMLQAGDRILAIDGEPVESAEQARAMLEGAAGVEVVVRVQRGEELERTFVIARERFEIE